MSRLTRWIDRVAYPGHGNHWDDELFRQRLLARLRPDSVCLEFGAGRGRLPQMNLRGLAAHVAGVDPDPAVRSNQFLDEAAVIDATAMVLPFADQRFDLVFADNVMEHVDDPVAALREIRRVLKPGGRMLAKTPNKWHYMPLIARCTPTGFHRFYNRLRGREHADTFPTRYRCNSAGDVRAQARAAGLLTRTIERIEGRPEYLRLWAPLYALGWLYERTVTAVPWLAPWRCVLIFELERPE